jgi:hypothetical protein
MTTWSMRSAFSIHTAAYTYSGCVILISFPLQQWFHECCSMLRYMYIASLIITKKECVYCKVVTEILSVIQVKFTYEVSRFFEIYLREVYRWSVIILLFFEVRSLNCGKRQIASSHLSASLSVLPSILPSDRVEQLGSRRKDFHEI